MCHTELVELVLKRLDVLEAENAALMARSEKRGHHFRIAFAGLLGTDRGSSYEAQALADIEQQKCLSHLLKNLHDVENTERPWHTGWNIGLACSPRAYRARGKPIEANFSRLIRDRVLTDAATFCAFFAGRKQTNQLLSRARPPSRRHRQKK